MNDDTSEIGSLQEQIGRNRDNISPAVFRSEEEAKDMFESLYSFN